MSASAASFGLIDAAHWVIPELDARGEIDRHTAMCVRFTIDDLVAGGAGAIVIDLRDVTAVTAEGLALLTHAHGVCRRAGGVQLGLLIGGGVGHESVAGSLQRAGLDTQSHTPRRPVPAPAPARSRRQRRVPALAWVTRTGRG